MIHYNISNRTFADCFRIKKNVTQLRLPNIERTHNIIKLYIMYIK